MAEATVTVKLTPGEYNVIVHALDRYDKWLKETIDTMSPADGRSLRQEKLKVEPLYSKLI